MRILKLTSVVVLFCTALFFLVYSLAVNGVLAPESPSTPSGPPPPQAPEITMRKMDLHTLLSRIRFSKDYAPGVIQQALSAYDAANPPTASWYADGRTAVELYVCRTVGEDFYGEGLLQNADAHAAAAYSKGCRDPLILTICDVYCFQERISLKLESATRQLDHCKQLVQSDYPPICKVDAATSGLTNTVRFLRKANRKNWGNNMTPAEGNVQIYLDIVLAELSRVIAGGCPEDMVTTATERLLSATNSSPELMEILDKKLDATLAAAGAPANIRALSRGNFLSDWAWTARGDEWAKEVTPEGWRLMKERLDAAQKVLEDAEEAFPEDPGLPTQLLTVELGQGIGKYRMERLFNKAVTLDPGNYQAYSRKMYYLQPRWHGSPQEVVEFGAACIDSGRWSDKIPLVFIEGMDLMADQDERLYENQKVWEAVHSVYQQYLERYPESVRNRTKYLQWAVKTKHWDIAREQQRLLGGNWDRSVLDDEEYLTLARSIPSPS